MNMPLALTVVGIITVPVIGFLVCTRTAISLAIMLLLAFLVAHALMQPAVSRRCCVFQLPAVIFLGARPIAGYCIVGYVRKTLQLQAKSMAVSAPRSCKRSYGQRTLCQQLLALFQHPEVPSNPGKGGRHRYPLEASGCEPHGVFRGVLQKSMLPEELPPEDTGIPPFGPAPK